MSKKSNTSSSSSSSTTTTTTTRSSGYLMNILSYIAVCVGGIALFVAMILGKIGVSTSITGILQAVANAIGWAVLCILSFRYIRRRKKIWMWVIWAIALVMIIIGIILPIF